MRPALLAAFLLVSGTALAVPPPRPAPPPRPPTAIDKLFAQLAKADSAEDAKPIEQKIEAQFRVSGSPSVDLLMGRAQQVQAAGDTKTALKLVKAVTDIAPTYAEGWHVRAALENADGDDTAALVSLQKTVELNPRHFTAMSELADMLQDYGDKKGALALYRRALALDPQLDDAGRKLRELTRTVEGQDI